MPLHLFLINIRLIFIATLTSLSINIDLTLANGSTDRDNDPQISEKLIAQNFTSKAKDLLISPDDNLSDDDKLESIKQSKGAIEIGEYSCHSEISISFGNQARNTYVHFSSNLPMPRDTKTLQLLGYPSKLKNRLVHLESSEKFSKSWCNKPINLVSNFYLINKNLFLKNRINNSKLEANVQNSWNKFLMKQRKKVD